MKLLSRECSIDFSRPIIVKFKKIRGTTTTKIGHTDELEIRMLLDSSNSNIETVRQWIQCLQNSE